MKPIIKYNNGIGAILCNECRVIIKRYLTKKELGGNTDLLFCEKCKLKVTSKIIQKSKRIEKKLGIIEKGE